MRVLESSFLGSAADPKGFPALGEPEIAMAGRSNVGKSSAINALTGRRGLAIASRTPGRTRLINFFELLVERGTHQPPLRLRLVDLPGFGFAKASKEERRSFSQRVEGYLDRPSLIALVHLLDLRHPPTELDRGLVAWARERDLPCIVVGTKADKLSRNDRLTCVKRLESDLSLPRGAAVVFSAQSGEGREALLGRIAEAATSWRRAPPAS